MGAYLLRRLLLMVPTLFGIMLINFIVVQAAPGGPVEQTLAKIRGDSVSATARVSGSEGADGARTNAPSSTGGDSSSRYRGAQGLDPDLIADIEKLYGFDKPAHERFFKMIKDYVRFDFGESFFRDTSVVELVIEKLPVSISLGLWTTLLVYLISIPLGIKNLLKKPKHQIQLSLLLQSI